jgi:peptidoglycan L-alanyl-D-glutamate endopeptidase CwlK
MTFRLGASSETALVGVRPPIVSCVRRAITTTTQDFGAFEGVRTIARQKLLLASGASRTLDSYHLTGDAVDLVPYVGGRLQWQMPLAPAVATAMKLASVALATPLVCGAVWDRYLSELDTDNLQDEIEQYVQRYRRIHGPKTHPLVDPWHFQGERP